MADVTGEYEFAQGGYKLTAVLGGSPAQTLGLRLAFRTGGMDDYLSNDYTGKDAGGSDETIVCVSTVWEPTDALSFDIKYGHGDFDVDGNLGEQWGPYSLNQLLLLGLEAGDGKWNFALIGTNLTNETILNNSFPVFNSIGLIRSPRMIWLQMSWRFFSN